MTLILGGSGQLGTELRRILPNAVTPSRLEFNLADPKSLRSQITKLRPDRVINCAAFTGVDAAEEDEEAAVLLNGTAVGEMAAAADALGIPFVTFSSDYVFGGADGEEHVESHPPSPISAYGRSKAHGEQLALKYSGSLVIRTSWLISSTHPNFVTTILDKARVGAVSVVDDQWGRPTLVGDLASAVVDVSARGLTGLLHLASPPTINWFGLAREACRLAGIDPERVAACSTADYPRPARRPRHAVLASERVDIMPDWSDGLAALVRSL